MIGVVFKEFGCKERLNNIASAPALLIPKPPEEKKETRLIRIIISIR